MMRIATQQSSKRSAATHAAAEARVRPARSRPSEVLPDVRELYRALEASEQRLHAALQRASFLEQQISLLEQEVVDAHLFAHRDELTGLPSRRLLVDRFNQAVAQATRHQQRVVLLFLDLDGFKRINDTFGHTVGDRLLQQVAKRLTECLRASDTACRYGGDEFVVLLPEFEGYEGVAAVAQKIRARLTPPYLIDGTSIEMNTSIGTAVYPVDGTCYGELIHASDLAMYREKPRISEPFRPG